MRKPVIALVNGVTVAGGLELVLACDFAYAARSARLGDGHMNFAQIGGGGVLTLLPRLIGLPRARELVFSGRLLSAEEALEWGLVNRVHDDAVLMEEAMKLAHDLANGPTIALSLIRKLYWDSPENSFEEQLNLEFESQRVAGSSEDFREGVTAFLEKRPAAFKGK